MAAPSSPSVLDPDSTDGAQVGAGSSSSTSTSAQRGKNLDRQKLIERINNAPAPQYTVERDLEGY